LSTKEVVPKGESLQESTKKTIEKEKIPRLQVLSHIMVPEHTIMEKEEVIGLYILYGGHSERSVPDISEVKWPDVMDFVEKKLPKIYNDDPAVKAIKAKEKDVIRIVKKSDTAGRSESYRFVIRRPKK